MIRTMVNREYKSNLFAMIFSDRENALSLYNSINGTTEKSDYQQLRLSDSFVPRRQTRRYWNASHPIF